MKKIKIRFIERTNSDGKIDYLIQRKKILGWSYFMFPQSGGAGDTFWYFYCKDDKNDLLKQVIDEVYKTTKSHVSVEEHPMIKLY
jgi:hypothetical protein